MTLRRFAMVRSFLLLCAAAIPALPAAGDIFPENDYPDFTEIGDVDPSVPTPSAFLGHRVGARPVPHDRIVEYFRLLAESSPRAELRTYAQSYEGRDLVYLIVSSPESMERIEEIKADLSRLADPRTLSTGDRQSLIAKTPAVAWLGYTIHGDEMSGSDGAVALAYRLIAGRDPEVLEILQNEVVLIDPIQNPDGRERFLGMVRSFNGRVPNSDTQGLAHEGFWPWGRGNHYNFDLNRDWFPLVHPESRGRVGVITEWHPQLVVDGHGMGSDETFLFSPPREPFNPYLTPSHHRWWGLFSKDLAAAFDRHGWSYYTREWNEEWYPGYGSTWALYTGAIGILYEQARAQGTVAMRPDGTLLTYGEAVHHQYVSSLANLLTAARNKNELLTDFVADRAQAVQLGFSGTVKSFLFPPGDDPERTRRLMETLLLQGIEVHVATEALDVRSLHDPWGGTWSSRSFPAGTYVVPVAQPAARLIRNIMDFHMQMADSFLVTEREHLERQKGSRLYDLSAWSVPLSYGVPVYWTGAETAGSLESVASLPPPEGGLENPDADYGFVIDGRTDDALRAAIRLVTEGFVCRVALDDFSVDGYDYPRGSFLFRRDANPEDLAARLGAVSREEGCLARGVTTARATSGPDLGGNRFQALVEPRIALLAGSPMSTTSTGSLWFLLDHETGLRVSLLNAADLGGADLGKYNVIVLPGSWGGGRAYTKIFGDDGVARLRSWVEGGGTVIGVGTGASFLADSSAGMSAVRERADVLDDYPYPLWGLDLKSAMEIGLFQATGVGVVAEEKEAAPPPERTVGLGIPGLASPVLGPGAVPFAGPGATAWTPPAATDPKLSSEEWTEADRRARRFSPEGVFLSVDLDPEHWLTSGLPERIAALTFGSSAFIARDPVRTVARFSEPASLHVSGLLWPEAAGRLANTAVVTREGMGRGQVILISVPPFFRACTHSTKRLFLNAALLGPGMGTRQTTPW